MPLSSFTQQDVTTRLGVVRLWTSPAAADVTRPMVFAIPSALSTVGDLAKILGNLGLLADGCLMRLPDGDDAALSACSVAELSRLVGELIETRFVGRPVVLLGASAGALIALGVRAANLARIVAIEPPLVTDGLWPVARPLRDHLLKVRDATASAFSFETFGIREDREQSLNHLDLLRDLRVPVDVVLGEIPLQPPRELSRFPSLVDEPERRFLAGLRGVRLHIARGAGHNVVGQAFRLVHGLVQEACRRASARLPADRLRLDEPLLEATSLNLRRILHWGPDGAVFADALQRMNPKCDVVVLGDDEAIDAPHGAAASFDAIVLARPAPADLLAQLAARLQPSGHLIARWAASQEVLRAALAPHGLVPRESVDDAGAGVMRAQKLDAAQEPRPALFLKTVAYASVLMDIRTRLPIRGLRSDPDLRVVYEAAPFELPELPLDFAKVLVLQRPAELRVEVWRPFLARAIRDGWIVVIEYDDYPPLVMEVLGRPSSEAEMLRLGYVHAVQTATPPLVELFRPYNPETALFPNAVFELPPYPQGPRPRRVFYGAMIRGRYAVEVARSLAPAIRRHPDTEFVVIGDREVFEALPTEVKRFHDYMSFEAYLDLMSQCTISLSPIEALRWRETKSDAKFLDAARAGVLTIASPTIYDRVIEHGVNGFLAPQVADWAPLLDQALTDEPLRERMARNAWSYVREERMFANQVALRRDWYFDLWSRRGELNEALMRRVPGLREAAPG